MARKYGFKEFYAAFKSDFKANNDIERLQNMLGDKIASSITPSVASNLTNNGLRRKEANQICLSGIVYYTNHFNYLFGEKQIYFDKLQDKISDFQKRYSVLNAVIQEFDDDIFQNLAALLVSAAANDLFYLKHNDNVPLNIDTEDIITDSFAFLKTQNINDIAKVSIMLHSGFNWYQDYKPDGRDALLKSIVDSKKQLRILINTPDSIQAIYDTKYLNTGYGIFPKQNHVIEEWKKLAQRRRFPLKAFSCVLFHSLCIIELKNGQKILYASHYIYNHISDEKHPKCILFESDPYFKVYYDEFEFIWENGEWLYNPENPEIL